MQSRRQIIRGCAAALAINSLPSYRASAQARQKIVVASPQGFQTEYSDLFNAYSGGHYERENIDATVVAANGVQSIQQLAAGQVQFIRNTAVGVVLASVAKLPIVSVATLSNKPKFFIVSLKDKPIHEAKDLRGKVLGLPSPLGSGASVYAQLALANAKVDLKDIETEVVGTSPNSIEMMKQGRIDAYVTVQDVILRLEKMPTSIHYWPTADSVKMPGDVYVTTRDVIARDPDLVRRFMRAIKSSIDEIRKTPLDQIFNREAKDFEMTGLQNMQEAIALEKASIDTYWLDSSKPFLNEPANWQSGVENMREAGFSGISDKAETYYTNDFIP